ncbi:MAG: hypothetical protein ABFD79_08605, partial [Phycisphaerales bacterium]
LKWLPWKYVFRKLALSHGFADPITIMSHIRRFSQPAEVHEPIELLRAGMVFHARGLINGRVIQHNMDWIWPWWINRQFNPQNPAFIPGAVSFSHVNLSGRNWTAVGLPDFSNYPIVDPCGLITPFWDSWSVDAWIVSDKGHLYVPAQMENVEQKIDMAEGLSIVTTIENENFKFTNKAEADYVDDKEICRIKFTIIPKFSGMLVVSLRPYNPEGISFIHEIEFNRQEIKWKINKKHELFLNKPPDKHLVSDYRTGDVSLKLNSKEKECDKMVCNVEMATAAAIYNIEPDVEEKIEAVIAIDGKKIKKRESCFGIGNGNMMWKKSLEGYCRLNLPWNNFELIYDEAVRAVILHSPGDAYPGPFTYKRFWFRDAAFIVSSLLSAGLIKRAEKIIDGFFARQKPFGYFHSQEGEWDSNGQVLWVMNKYCSLTNSKPKESWVQPVIKGAKWIIRKRLAADSISPCSGLMPAGFSAEHLGPSDYYYWDDFWSAAGLYAAAQMLKGTNHDEEVKEFVNQADDLMSSISRSLDQCEKRIGRSAMPASPNRRLDSGAVGSLVAIYPVQLFDPSDQRVRDTTAYLAADCLFKDCFYHEISHSGINPYLTLHLAQALMRCGDQKFARLVNCVAMFASPTGQWPEAANPRIGTGCMGDGQHIWACAEWIIMMINLFVIEEKNKLIIGKGILKDWLKDGHNISIGPVWTSFGQITININRNEEKLFVNWDAKWFTEEKSPQISVELPGFEKITAEPAKTGVELKAGK